MNNFKAALFDMDGTLIDSSHVWAEIDVEFLARRDKTITEEYKKEIVLLSSLDLAKYTIDYYNLDETPQDLAKEWLEMAIHHYSNTIKLKPFVYDYLVKLKQEGIKIALCTAAPRALYEPVLKNNNIYDFFETLVSTDDVKRGKAFPDVYLEAAKRLDISPENCVVFEDVLEAVKSAKQAKMAVVGVYDVESKSDAPKIKQFADFYIYDFSQMDLIHKQITKGS